MFLSLSFVYFHYILYEQYSSCYLFFFRGSKKEMWLLPERTGWLGNSYQLAPHRCYLVQSNWRDASHSSLVPFQEEQQISTLSDKFFLFLITILRKLLAMDYLMETEIPNENNSKIDVEDSTQCDQMAFKCISKHNKFCYKYKFSGIYNLYLVCPHPN